MIIELIREQPLSARDISIEVRIAEREVYEHLEHIRLTIQPHAFLEVTPADCRSCGFVFSKRDRLTPPGKCPVCRGESIEDPLFSIRDRHS